MVWCDGEANWRRRNGKHVDGSVQGLALVAQQQRGDRCCMNDGVRPEGGG